MGAAAPDWFYLQRRIAEAVYQRVNVLPGLAQGAVAGVEAGVIRQAGGVEDGGDRVAEALVGGGKNSRKPCHDAAVVVYGFHGCLNGVAGGDGCGQNEDVLALDHGSKIIPQNDLAAGGVFRRDDVDGLVGVHIGKAVLGQLVWKLTERISRDMIKETKVKVLIFTKRKRRCHLSSAENNTWLPTSREHNMNR